MRDFFMAAPYWPGSRPGLSHHSFYTSSEEPPLSNFNSYWDIPNTRSDNDTHQEPKSRRKATQPSSELLEENNPSTTRFERTFVQLGSESRSIGRAAAPGFC